MKKENLLPTNTGDLNGRITRARAAALRTSGKVPFLNAPMQQDQKRILRASSKRAALAENTTSVPGNEGTQNKRRAVLQDVTNVCCEKTYKNWFGANKVQAKNVKQGKKGQLNVLKIAPSVAAELPCLQTNSKTKVVLETRKEQTSVVVSSTSLEEEVHSQLSNSMDFGKDTHHLPNQISKVLSQLHSPSKKAEKCSLSDNRMISRDPDYTDIDCDQKDPQLCSLYATEIYSSLRVAELVRRPCPTFMKTVQRDITQSMRGILVDWLVEVSEEYKLVPDTVYLTVYLIDCYLSQNYIERQRLQLLGITCMLIASKYEEICALRVEEFCFITDNTYTREEVLKMEIQVLKCLGFQIFTPTAKTFLRRFLRAAQASYKSPSYKLEYLANYLAELTLVDYKFLNFLPSVIAASAVFLARWTLDQTCQPWNSTLEHYSSYKASDLKAPLLALQDLQMNTNGCPLNAIRMKYRQEKFKSVASLSSPKLLETLF